jgi:hypothetical protein
MIRDSLTRLWRGRNGRNKIHTIDAALSRAILELEQLGQDTLRVGTLCLLVMRFSKGTQCLLSVLMNVKKHSTGLLPRHVA